MNRVGDAAAEPEFVAVSARREQTQVRPVKAEPMVYGVRGPRSIALTVCGHFEESSVGTGFATFGRSSDRLT